MKHRFLLLGLSFSFLNFFFIPWIELTTLSLQVFLFLVDKCQALTFPVSNTSSQFWWVLFPFKFYLGVPCLTYVLLENMLFNFLIFWNFRLLLLLISNLIPGGWEQVWWILCFSHLLRWILWFRMWSILVNVPCKFKNYAYLLLLEDV